MAPVPAKKKTYFIGREIVGTARGINNVEKHHDGCFLPHTVQCTVLHECTRKKNKTVYIVYQQKERHSSCAKHLKEIVLR